MAKPKHKSMRNQPEMYDELKQARSLSLTLTAIIRLDSHAKNSGISRSELVEQFARGLDELQARVSPNQKGDFDMAKPKHKSMRNQPEMYDELKQAYSLSLTPTAIKRLDSQAKKSGISRSELVEQYARGLEELEEQPPTQTNH